MLLMLPAYFLAAPLKLAAVKSDIYPQIQSAMSSGWDISLISLCTTTSIFQKGN